MGPADASYAFNIEQFNESLNHLSEGLNHLHVGEDGSQAAPAQVLDTPHPQQRQEERATAQSLGVHPMPMSDPRFEEVANAGLINWVVTESGDLLVVPQTVGIEPLAQDLVRKGQSVLAAGEARIAVDGESAYVFEITNQSHHSLTDQQSQEIGHHAFQRDLRSTFASVEDYTGYMDRDDDTNPHSERPLSLSRKRQQSRNQEERWNADSRKNNDDDRQKVAGGDSGGGGRRPPVGADGYRSGNDTEDDESGVNDPITRIENSVTTAGGNDLDAITLILNAERIGVKLSVIANMLDKGMSVDTIEQALADLEGKGISGDAMNTLFKNGGNIQGALDNVTTLLDQEKVPINQVNQWMTEGLNLKFANTVLDKGISIDAINKRIENYTSTDIGSDNWKGIDKDLRKGIASALKRWETNTSLGPEVGAGHDGDPFRNDEQMNSKRGILKEPFDNPQGILREYYVDHLGSQRILIDSSGRAYYYPDHYDPGTRIPIPFSYITKIIGR